MIKRKTLMLSTFACIIWGVFTLVRVMEQPQFRSYQNGDVVRLILSGICFGVALTGLLSLVGRAKTS